MKLVGVKEFYNITRAKVISAANCGIVILACAIATFAVDTALNSNNVQAKPIETSTPTSANPEVSDPTEPGSTDVTGPSTSGAPAVLLRVLKQRKLKLRLQRQKQTIQSQNYISPYMQLQRST